MRKSLNGYDGSSRLLPPGLVWLSEICKWPS
jgi:hypothetical protein